MIIITVIHDNRLDDIFQHTAKNTGNTYRSIVRSLGLITRFENTGHVC